MGIPFNGISGVMITDLVIGTNSRGVIVHLRSTEGVWCAYSVDNEDSTTITASQIIDDFNANSCDTLTKKDKESRG